MDSVSDILTSKISNEHEIKEGKSMKDYWHKKKIIWIIIAVGIILATFMGLSIKVTGKFQNKSQNQLSVYSGNISMTIDYGYNQYAKYGRYMNVRADVTNEGKDFHGWLQVVAPKLDNNVLYRKEVKVEAETTKNISINIPLTDDTGILQVKLLDDDGKTVVEKEAPIKIGNYQKDIFIGILSDNVSRLDYTVQVGSQVFYLNEENMADSYLGLDLLDVIIVNQYDTSRLSELQIKAIQQWVYNGGTLVLGTGEYAKDTLAKFQDVFSIQYQEELEDYELTFGMNKKTLEHLKRDIIQYDEARKALAETLKQNKASYNGYSISAKDAITTEEAGNKTPSSWVQEILDELTILPIHKNLIHASLKDELPKVMEEKHILMEVSPYGFGNVQLFNLDMGLEPDQESFGIAMYYSMLKNISSTKRDQLDNEFYGNYVNYNIYNSMSYVDTENIPNVGKYIAILAIYVVIVGPVLFIILKKIDKRSLTWVLVPSFAIVFTAIVYWVGSDTRISEPYVGYVELLSFEEENIVQDNVYFSLTAPYNKKYKVDIDNKYQVVQLSDSNSKYTQNRPNNFQPDLDRYQTAIKYGTNKTTLEVNRNAAFTPIYYYSKNHYPMENKITLDIHYVGDEMYGTITNGFSFDITNALVKCDGFIINIGTLKKGETININDKESQFLISRDDLYSTTIINRIAGGTEKREDNTADVNRRDNILQYLLEPNMQGHSKENFLIGFIQEDIDQSLIGELSNKMDAYGTKAIQVPFDVNHTKESKTFVPSIEPYEEVDKLNQDNYYNYKFLENGMKTIEYQLPPEEKILSFSYLSNRNKVVNKEYSSNFSGNIYFLNYRTGTYDLVFTTGSYGSLDDVSSYITDENKITIRYESGLSPNEYQVILPNISYWKGADHVTD